MVISRGFVDLGEIKMAYVRKLDQSVAARRHYESNKRQYKDRARKFTSGAVARNREAVLKFLQSHPCVDCGESDPVVLDFDHVRGNKTKEVTKFVRNGASLRRIFLEIDKCEVRCANCHRRITAKRRQGERQDEFELV